ncbi:MAG: ABC transporter permease [Firmicutes bacterium]|nr:ABC transporter permease [Bacillota bacterium]
METLNKYNIYFHGEKGALMVLLFLCLIIGLSSPFFFNFTNIITILEQTTFIAIGAIGMTFVIISGGIDLSAGAILGGTSFFVLNLHANYGLNIYLTFLFGLLLGIFLGFLNGYLIAKFRLQSFIVTLCMMISIRGMIPLIGDGSIYSFSDKFIFLTKGTILSIPFSLFLLLVVILFAHIILNHTKIGRFIYAIGNNEKAASLYGISNKKYKIYAYIMSGFSAALAGLVLASRLNAVTTTTGRGYELDVIAAVVLGGTRLSGGEGGIVGSLIGALIIGVVHNGLNLLMVNSFVQQIIIGFVILITVIFDSIRLND